MEVREEIQAGDEHFKMRLEDLLLGHFRHLSKIYLREVVKTGRCEVNGRHENIGYRVRPNDLIEVFVDHSKGTAMRAEDIALDIVHEDDEIIVVVKPVGMLVHPSHRENTGTLLNALTYHLNRSSSSLIRPGLPHRLDKQTSGLIVAAKTPRAHRILSNQFLKRRVSKRYMALVEGIVEVPSGEIEARIGRFDELKYWGVRDDGKPSLSRFAVIEHRHDATLLELEPVTGRTNQLRIHCAAMGHPIVGDVERGGRPFSRLCLHASELSFAHPSDARNMRFASEVDYGL
jgi:23S rRNA pseudouridine1911/1915/1917 synthase